MIKHTLIVFSGLALGLTFSTLSLAAEPGKSVGSAEAPASHPRLKAEYEQALAAADASRTETAAALGKAREQLHMAAQRRDQNNAKSEELHDRQQTEMAVMRRELGRAHRQLRETSREISRVNRDLARARMAGEAAEFVLSSGGDRPVLGVILGGSTDVGIKVLGVSPDGPAERAGIKAGDIVVALGGRVLAATDEAGNPRSGLKIALKDITAGEPVIVSVERQDETLDLTVVPEVREPLSWQSVVRFGSPKNAPFPAGAAVMVERLEVPQIDSGALSEQIENMRIEIEARVESALAPMADVRRYEFQFDNMSEMGDFALHDANAWFGMPLASGLRLAAINPALGTYFKTDRGVLILQARKGNDLLLQAGDVVLDVHGTQVNSPADFMRALRKFEPGDELLIDIKRKRKSKTLKPVIEDSQALFVPEDHALHTLTVTTNSD